ncbi:autotransporter domain-containing protein [Alcaligenes sp. WGS1538]|uniref:autotransporter outer membrane beta-barrel domain-containing protein n=1 Tax=Alcaligenes sp. WGS1538 TaxID=3366811 RepID=UPI00372D864A
MDFKIKALLGVTLLAMATATAQAYQTEIIYNKKGEAAFELRIYNPGDGIYDIYDPDDPTGSESTFKIDENGRQKVRAALERWAEILTLKPGYRPAIINLGSMDDYNAGAYSNNIEDKGDPHGIGLTALQAALLNKLGESDFSQAQAVISVGTLPFDSAPVTPSQLPLTGQVDYNAVIFHELGHALGIANTVEDREGSNTPYFDSDLNRWAAGLRDDNGNPARPDQAVLCIPCNNPYDPDAFDLRKDQGYFTGSHVLDALDGAMPGIPVSILDNHDDPQAGVDTDYMSHSELRNSLMSHQPYRNYTGFMEAEIAALQDMGLHIDRKNFFGYSVYGNDVTLTNTRGFFARNANGTAYLPGQYNQATQGLGLHIYGERNTITQAADLLSAGPGGVGVRVDGSENTLIIPQATRIHAQGWYGRGLQFSYGRHHTIVQQGEVRADGQDGVGALFDFGNNMMGNDGLWGDYRGSWLWKVQGESLPPPEILQGALVNNYDLSGPLSGRRAAIQISDNAWVQNINIMQGAAIQGDILSNFSMRRDNEQLVTRVSFGQKADAQGRATLQADPNFRLHYEGNIQGGDNLAVAIAGGAASLNGNHVLYSLRVDPGATLSGNSSYTINPEDSFINNGTLSPGNSFGQMSINGRFIQGPQGRILIEADTRQHDRIEVNGLAELAGELKIQLQPDWYADGWTLNQDKVFSATQTQGGFDQFSANVASPTLAVQTGADGVWRVKRSPTAYTQYAATTNAAAVGRSLEQASTDAQRPLASAYQALDFSRPDGSDISHGLDQLSAGAYGAQLAASLRREQLVSEQLRQRPGLGKDGWQTFIQPFGGNYRWQLGSNDVDHRSHTYGVLFGAEHRASGSDWSLGLHATANEQRLNMDAPFQAKSTLTGLGAGVHALYRADARQGWSGVAQVRAGLEQGKLNRRIDFAGYQASPSADWTGHTLAAGIQAAYNWPLGETGRIGPVLALDYLRYSRPGLSEEGEAASRLRLDSSHAEALQASLGLAARQSWELKQGRRLQADVSAAWEQALLGRRQTQHARFDASAQTGFEGRYVRVDRQALALRAGLTLHASERLRLGLTAGTRLLGESRADISGNVSLNWFF